MMEIPERFISCDWGTTNFRLRVIDSKTLNILNEYVSNQGIKDLYQEFSNQNIIDKSSFYSNFLKEKSSKIIDSEEKYIIVASGMISSSMGMCELGYTAMPFNSKGKEIFSKMVSISRNLSVLMISGVKQDDDVMRGEEVQAIGLANYLEDLQSGVLLLPGTHSKHLSFRDKNFHKLDTFMTGEMFAMLSKHSILSNSVESGSFNDLLKASFIEGVLKGDREGISRNLFKIRAKDLLENKNKVQGYYYLSGLLIGEELSYLKDSEKNICMAATGTLNNLYQIALKTLIKDKNRLVFFGEDVLDKALLIGQRKILQQQFEYV